MVTHKHRQEWEDIHVLVNVQVAVPQCPSSLRNPRFDLLIGPLQDSDELALRCGIGR